MVLKLTSIEYLKYKFNVGRVSQFFWHNTTKNTPFKLTINFISN